MFGLSILIILAVLAILAPYICRYNYAEMNLQNAFAPPSRITGWERIPWAEICFREFYTADASPFLSVLYPWPSREPAA